nr:hypothetical protein [Tanacetum cinerariifolium]
MIAILEKSEHNVNFHPIVDFVEASHIRIKTTNEGTKILATVDGKSKTIYESSIKRNLKLNDEEGISTLPDAELFENLAPMGYNILPNQKFIFQKEILTLRQYSRRATQIAQSKALPTAADEPASLLRDDSQGEAFPTGSMQQKHQELMDLYIHLQRQQTEMATKIAELFGDDAPIKGRSIEIGEEAGVEKSTERGISIVGVPTGSGLVPTVSTIFTTASVVTPYSRRPREISAKDKGKEKMMESDTPKKKQLQEQIDVQMAREMEEQMAKEDQRMDEQIARDAKIARIHVEEELQMIIDGLDRNNEVIVKHLQEEKIDLINELVKYQDHHAKILKYQAQQSKPLSKKEQMKFYMSVLRSHSGWKTNHFRGMTLVEIKVNFIHVWKKIEDFVLMASKEEGERVKRKGLKLKQGSVKKMKTSEDVSKEDLKEMMQLVPVEEVYVEEVYVEALQVKHLIIDWEIHTEGKRDYWKIIRLGGHTTVYQFFVDMLKKFDREDLNQLWTLVKETLSIRQASSDKEKELWVELKRLFESDFKYQLWTQTQALMHDPVEWRLYDTCGVYHVFTRDQEIFMLVEREYPLRRGLAIVMISNKLQVENYSQMANDLTMKIHNIANSPR